MLIIQSDPAGVTGRIRRAWDLSVSMQANIERHLPGGGGDSEVRINGALVDPMTDPRLDRAPLLSDLVVVSRRPGADWVVYAAYIIAAIAAIYAYSTIPDTRGLDDGAGNESPNNKLTAQTNIARAYQGIPDVYGLRRCWPDLIQPSVVEYIAHVKFVTEWLCISRGRGDISNVQYAETPIGDIDGSSYEVFAPAAGGYPELQTTTLNDVYEVFASDDVNGQEIPYAIAYPTVTADGSFAALEDDTTFDVTIPDSPELDLLKSLVPAGAAVVQFSYGEADEEGGAVPTFNATVTVLAFEVDGDDVTFSFSSPAWEDDASGDAAFTIIPQGATRSTIGPFTLPIAAGQLWWNTVFLRGLKGALSIKAEWWRIDAFGVEIGGSRETRTDVYTDGTFDQRFYTTKVTPAAGVGQYRMQFTRLDGQVDSSGADVAKLEEIYAVRHYPTKVLPGVTVLRVTTKATLAATGFAERKFNLRWNRVVRTLTTDTLSASRNFARSIAHIWTLAGNDIAGLDTDALAAINAEHGEDSALLRFDGSLDDAQMSLGERMQLIANTARCAIWRDGTKWTATRDQARPYPEMQFDYRNLAAAGESTISYAAHLPASFDGVELEYVDESSQSKKAYVRLNIETGSPVVGTSSNPRKVQMLGCTTTAQAENRARLEARRLIYQRVSVSDTALSDAWSLGLGALVRWVDPEDFAGDDGLQAGEVMSIAGAIIATSEPLDWGSESSGRIVFTGADGRQLGSPVRCFPDSAGVRLDSVPIGLYVADVDRQCGSRYAFAIGLTNAEVEASGLYAVNEIRPAADGTVSIALSAYDARIYADD